jgi:hypothetical protein
MSGEFSFEPDESVQRMAERAAGMIVDAAPKIFDVTLDGSEASIEQVDQILNQLHDRTGVAEVMPDDMRSSIADALGYYAGQLYCRYQGGTWGVLSAGEDRVAAIRDGQGRMFSPTSRAHKQLEAGSADSLGFFYRYLAGTAPAASK